ncbi:MAG: type II toxin-antitoxin system Phd/YefM family antitoxin [Deltaproteobacteria bacterium]|nr:type II toxin-antitoxin system Phd/YefM family antitoxin [Deltaproteobacteria bacterium]
MVKALTALEVRGHLGEILEEVFYKGKEYIIKRGKKSMAVLMPVEEFENYRKQREKDMGIFDQIRSKNRSYSEEEVAADVEEALKAVRKQ